MSFHFPRCLLMPMLLGLAANAVAQQTAIDGFAPQANLPVRALALQDDGKIVVGGDFSTMNSQSFNRLARLHPDGSLDTGFFSPLNSGTVRSILVEDDGDLVIGGNGMVLNEIIVAGALARMSSNGTTDVTFTPFVNGTVHVVISDGEGGYFVGGEFSLGGSPPRNNLARVTASGAIDPNWIGTASAPVFALARDIQGRLYVGRGSNPFEPGTVSHLQRLLRNGAPDARYTAHVDGPVRALLREPNGDLVIGGDFNTVNGVSRLGVARLDRHGVLDDPFHTVSIGVRALARAASGRLFVGGDIDLSFSPNLYHMDVPNSVTSLPALSPAGTDGDVHAMLMLPDGALVIGGSFTTVGAHPRARLARIEGNRHLDVTMAPSFNGGDIMAAIATSGNALFVSGEFSAVDGEPRGRMAGIHVSGSLVGPPFSSGDPQLNAPALAMAETPSGDVLVAGAFTSAFGRSVGYFVRMDGLLRDIDPLFPTQANDTIRCIAIQSDQSFLIGGDFTSVNGATRRGIARLTVDGELDTAFNLNLPAGSVVTSIAVQRDGAIVLGGAFSQVAGVARANLARVSSSGVLDTGFNPAPNGRVETLFLQPNNDLLVGGAFGTIAGGNRVRVARLNGDGTLDTGFDAALSTSITRVHTVAQQADGGIWIGGSNNLLTRRTSAGAVDAAFTATVSGTVRGIVPGVDGKTLVFGSFSTLAGQSRNSFGRLVDRDRDAFQGLIYDDNFQRLLWRSGNSAPNVIDAPVLHEFSPGFNDFIELGPMSRTSVFWRRNTLLPFGVETKYQIRTRHAGGPAGSGSASSKYTFLMFREDELLSNDFE
jgi:uncharacterized delta-60 repeat protein